MAWFFIARRSAARKTSDYKKARNTIKDDEDKTPKDENPKREAQSAPKKKSTRPGSTKTPVDAHSILGSEVLLKK